MEKSLIWINAFGFKNIKIDPLIMLKFRDQSIIHPAKNNVKGRGR